MVKIKNPFGYVQTNPQAYAWWIARLIFLKKCFSETPYYSVNGQCLTEFRNMQYVPTENHFMCFWQPLPPVF